MVVGKEAGTQGIGVKGVYILTVSFLIIVHTIHVDYRTFQKMQINTKT